MLLSLLFATFVSYALSQVSYLNRTQYLGRWYQAYSDFAVEATFENNSYCVTADYGVYPNNTVSVENRERNDNTSGSIRRILGWADAANAAKPGELTVHLQTTEFGAPYWIYDLGPATYNGYQYEYSVVSDPFNLTLFVLARNLTTFAKMYEQDVLKRLQEGGFTQFYNTPIPTVQTNCTYW